VRNLVRTCTSLNFSQPSNQDYRHSRQITNVATKTLAINEEHHRVELICTRTRALVECFSGSHRRQVTTWFIKDSSTIRSKVDITHRNKAPIQYRPYARCLHLYGWRR